MVCVSLGERSVASTLRALRRVRFAEIRLDRIAGLTEAGVRAIFSGPAELVATFRPSRVSNLHRFRLLAAAVEAGAAYIDIEIDTPAADRRPLIALARRKGCRVIVSYHDKRGTPPARDLQALRDRGFSAGADIVKIACLSRGGKDNARLLGLLDDPRPTIVIGMGKAGVLTRIAAPLFGAPFGYASSGPGKATAAGQITAPALIALWREIRNV